MQFTLISWNVLGHNYLTLPNHQHIVQKYPQIIDWPRRCALLCKELLIHNPDVICLQEVNEVMKNDLESMLLEQGFAVSAYQSKGNGGVLVLHKTEKLDVLKNGHTLLATNSSAKKGGCAWAVLQCKQSQKQFLVSSVHLHWQHSIQQIVLLKNIWKEPVSVPMLLVGDFNIAYKTMLNKIVPEVNQLNILEKPHAFSLFKHQSWTFCESLGWRSADHLLYSDSISLDKEQSFIGDAQHSYKSDLVLKAEDIIADTSKKNLPTDQYSSDHLPMIITLKIL
ncbi:MAG: endonuclease/exonuclease/phosphatase family metal-dependent hydrolase [Alteromonas naphthalenivorans]|jgi:endonuclease/exonuclease/phosphatase family metal-dependent hydrolase